MSKLEKSAYEVISGIAGIVLAVSLAALFFSHLQLQELNTTAGEVERMFSESAQKEHDLMTTVRVVSAVVSVSVLAVLLTVSSRYYELVDDPQWELKKGVIGGLVNVVLGLVFYILDTDLFIKSLSLSLISLGIFLALGNAIHLSLKSGGVSNTSSDIYCSSCGSGASKSDSYCPDCGTEL